MKSRQLFNCNADKEIAAVPLIQNAANEFKKCCLAVFLVAWVAWVARSLVSLVWVVNCGPAAWMDESTRNFLNSRLLAFFLPLLPPLLPLLLLFCCYRCKFFTRCAFLIKTFFYCHNLLTFLFASAIIVTDSKCCSVRK